MASPTQTLGAGSTAKVGFGAHPVAWCKAEAWCDFDNFGAEFVAEWQGRTIAFCRPAIPADNVQIRTADPRAAYSQECFVWTGGCEGAINQFYGLC